jgi:hypothetical protein
MPYRAVKIKTERVFRPPGSSEEAPDGYPAEWYYVGPKSWTLNETEATVLDDIDAMSIISCLEMEYPKIQFRFTIIQ